MRILVVDDVRYVRQHLDRLLSEHGHSVVTAPSGVRAIEILNEQDAFDVVITDLVMPGIDGLELFQRARRIDRPDETSGRPVPVFYLITALRPTLSTAQREPNMLQRALDLGFAGVLLKPIDNEHLLRELSNLEQTGCLKR